MNNLLPESGGVFIRPSARPSIHNHLGCLFAKGEIMARFGHGNNNRQVTNSSNQENGSPEADRGVDVVDNAWSQPAHPIRRSPSKAKRFRRNSLDTGYSDQSNTEYESGVLSKSAPETPTLPPLRLYYSDQSEDDEQEEYAERNNSYNSMDYLYSTPNRSNSSQNTSNTSPCGFNRTVLEGGFKPSYENKTFFSKATVSLISVVVILCGVVGSGKINITQSNAIKYDKSDFFTDVSSFGEKYSVDSDSILQVQMGISTIFEKEDAGSFIFVYNSKADNFDASEFNKFVNDISLAAAKYLRNSTLPLHYTTVDGAKLDMAEHSELICRYREQLGSTGVMLLRNLETVPSNLAMAFHYYCDEYNPLVKKTAVIFTMDLARCPSTGVPGSSSHYRVESCLRDLWSNISPDSLSPLLTRVVSVVIDVTNAF